MCMLTIYHGSPEIVKKPTFGLGNPNNDYGLGFYCTENSELAKEWACSLETSGYANKYTIDTKDLKILSLTGGEYNILNWLSVLLENRKFRIGGDVARQAKAYIDDNFSIDYKKYDIIKGYRADDSYFSFATAFLNSTISLSQLESAMVLGKLGEQVTLKSEKAFELVKFEKAIPAQQEIYYPKKLARDTEARGEFRKEKGRGSIDTEVYILDIMRERWKNDDERLQRVILG
ncbi:MAG: DUF3990 domain-containing protein [Eubacteriales bacterium]|nr:DUF3990 domain-containing protein [Eubacteriales bacterium]